MSTPLERVVAYFDNNQTRAAEAIGTSQQLISYHLKRGKQFPAEWVLPAERSTGISRHELRPDLYPIEDEPAPAEAA